MKPITMHYHLWCKKFEPINIDALHEVPDDTDYNYLWSELEVQPENDDDDDENQWSRVIIVEGYHPINNLGYFITKKPHNFDAFYEVE